MRSTLVAAAALAALVLAGGAAAGGWATVGVTPLPTGTEPGGTWSPELTVLQHGRTPLTGVQPSITIRNAATGETRTFAATALKAPGKYRASVVFPSAGTWSFAIDDGFSRTHTFKPVEIGSAGGAAAAASPAAATSNAWLLGGSAALASMLGGLLVLGRRRRTQGPLGDPVAH